MPTSPPSTLTGIAAAAGLVALTIYLLVVGEAIVMPLVLAIFISYLITALAHRLQRIKFGTGHMPGWLAMSCTILVLLLGIAGLVQLIAGSVRSVVAAAPQYQDQMRQFFDQIQALGARTLGGGEPLTFTTVLEQLNLAAIAARFASAFQAIAGNTLQIFAYVAFLLLESRILPRKLQALFPEPSREAKARATLTEIGRKLETYVLLKTGMSLLVGALSYAVLTAFGVDFAAFWALLIFVLNFIPYIGSPLGMLFPTLLALLQFESLATAAIVLACLIGVQTVIENVVEPRLAGSSLNLSPVVIMLSLSVWGAIWGIIGMIVSVPLMVMVMIVLAQFPRTRPIAVLMSATGDVT